MNKQGQTLDSGPRRNPVRNHAELVTNNERPKTHKPKASLYYCCNNLVYSGLNPQENLPLFNGDAHDDPIFSHEHLRRINAGQIETKQNSAPRGQE